MFSILVVVVEGPDEVVEVEEKLLVVALAAVVVLLVGRRPSEYPMRQHIVQHPARAGGAESQRTASSSSNIIKGLKVLHAKLRKMHRVLHSCTLH